MASRGQMRGTSLQRNCFGKIIFFIVAKVAFLGRAYILLQVSAPLTENLKYTTHLAEDKILKVYRHYAVVLISGLGGLTLHNCIEVKSST